MASETQVMETSMTPQKRKCRQSKGTKGKKRAKVLPSTERKVKIDKRMKQLFRKRARNYNSDDDDDDEDKEEGGEIAKGGGSANERYFRREEVSYGNSSGEEEENGPENEEESEASEDDDGPEIQPGITKFAEGCRAFKMAFVKITKKNLVEEGVLGPVLSGHKKLVVEKLAEELAERKGKGEAKKEKFLVGEKGHVKPANFLDLHEKFLISVATKGVVKLFNAVNKAQNAQKGLNPSRFKDAKELEKRRKRAFLSELRNKPSQTADSTAKDDGGPGWAPLRESYMLTNSKLKNWDKMQDTTTAYDEDETMPHNSSSDED